MVFPFSLRLPLCRTGLSRIMPLPSTGRSDVIRDAIEAALEPGHVALVFPMSVGPARWTPLRDARYGRQFLQSALEREAAARQR